MSERVMPGRARWSRLPRTYPHPDPDPAFAAIDEIAEAAQVGRWTVQDALSAIANGRRLDWRGSKPEVRTIAWPGGTLRREALISSLPIEVQTHLGRFTTKCQVALRTACTFYGDSDVYTLPPLWYHALGTLAFSLRHEDAQVEKWLSARGYAHPLDLASNDYFQIVQATLRQRHNLYADGCMPGMEDVVVRALWMLHAVEPDDRSLNAWLARAYGYPPLSRLSLERKREIITRLSATVSLLGSETKH